MLKLFLAGDVMLGRAVDQILPHKSDPRLYESSVKDARDYLPSSLKKRTVSYQYPWGDLLDDPRFIQSDLKLINLETSVTTSVQPAKKEILYKMHPGNLQVIKKAKIDYCNLANNHVLDWGMKGLKETIASLRQAQLNYGGIGLNFEEAKAPVILPGKSSKNSRVLLFSAADVSSGTSIEWKAGRKRPGVNVVDFTHLDDVKSLAQYLQRSRWDDHDFTILSIHWGSNWGWEIEEQLSRAAHYLIDHGGVDLIHGHSSHHFRPLEIYRDRLILYGCGDLITDYETIREPIPAVLGSKELIKASRVSMAYYPEYQGRKLVKLAIQPYRLQDFQLTFLQGPEYWAILERLNNLSREFGISWRG
jgi:poly-gamma-glutamate capsule biosynthesis protein CapA/YwtB (metallophosphatase superfamily)